MSLKLAVFTLVGIIIVAFPLIYVIHYSKSRTVNVLFSILNLPIVLPPSVLGFYILVVYGKLDYFKLAFSFQGLVIASIIYNIPFFINPVIDGLSSLDKNIQSSLFILRKTKYEVFTKVLLPSVKSSIVTACILTFAHTIGEFGVVLMIGGSIPNETEVASIALFNEVEAMNYSNAHQYAITLLVVSAVILMLVQIIKGKEKFVRN